jgi:hypothetical protein
LRGTKAELEVGELLVPGRDADMPCELADVLGHKDLEMVVERYATAPKE